MSSTIAATMPAIKDGALAAYFIFDVADTIDLEAIAKMQSVTTERAQIRMRPEVAPSYIAFPVPPLSISLGDLLLFGHKGNARLKVYDYGVLSLRIEIPFSGSWTDFFELSNKVRLSPETALTARKIYEQIKAQLRQAFRKPHEKELLEDYYVYTVHEFSSKVLAQDLLSVYVKEVAGIMRNDSKVLAKQEVEEAVRVNLSFYEDDLSIIDWDVAFIFDRGDAAGTIESILEFANTQLVELRTYDATLNAELDWIYTSDPIENKGAGLMSHRTANQRAERIRLMLVDVRELMDRTNNALKIIGDAFYARVYRSVRSRLGLGDWEKQIDTKLQSVSAIYGYLTDQAQNARGEALEWIVIILIFSEIVLGILKH